MNILLLLFMLVWPMRQASGKMERETAGLVAALRRHIARIENARPLMEDRRGRGAPWTTGIPVIDSRIGPRGFDRTGLHDIAPKSHGDMPAAMGFALALALRRMSDPAERRPFLWCRLAGDAREYGRLYGHGLETMGLVRSRFLAVTLAKPAALLWTMEEALASGAFALVAADAPRRTGLTVTRRLSLAARAGKSAGLFVLRKKPDDAASSDTRWTIAAHPSQPPPHDPKAPGYPVWSAELTRARGGRPGAWIVEWHNASRRFSLVSGFRGGEIHPWTDQIAPDAAAGGHALRAG